MSVVVWFYRGVPMVGKGLGMVVENLGRGLWFGCGVVRGSLRCRGYNG